MKKLVNLKDVKTLSSTQQKTIFGGGDPVEHGDGQGGAGGGACQSDPCASNSDCPGSCTCQEGNFGQYSCA